MLERIARLIRQVFGMPDYHRYLEHRQRCHPGEPLLDAKTFYRQQIEQRYSGGMGRCC